MDTVPGGRRGADPSPSSCSRWPAPVGPSAPPPRPTRSGSCRWTRAAAPARRRRQSPSPGPGASSDSAASRPSRAPAAPVVDPGASTWRNGSSTSMACSVRCADPVVARSGGSRSASRPGELFRDRNLAQRRLERLPGPRGWLGRARRRRCDSARGSRRSRATPAARTPGPRRHRNRSAPRAGTIAAGTERPSSGTSLEEAADHLAQLPRIAPGRTGQPPRRAGGRRGSHSCCDVVQRPQVHRLPLSPNARADPRTPPRTGFHNGCSSRHRSGAMRGSRTSRARSAVRAAAVADAWCRRRGHARCRCRRSGGRWRARSPAPGRGSPAAWAAGPASASRDETR